MKKLLVGVMALLGIASMTSCYWAGNVTDPNMYYQAWDYGGCTVNLPSNSNSGWVKAKIDSSAHTNGIGPFAGSISGDALIPTASTQWRPSGPDSVLWNGGTTGEKIMIGIYPGETYRMGMTQSYVTYANGPMWASIRSRVVDGNNVEMSTSGSSQCALVSS